MAKLFELDKGSKMDEWMEGLHPRIRKVCEQYPPNLLYRMASTGHRVTIHSYEEDGTVCVEVTGEYNAVIFDRTVFGIDPAELVECDLPPSDEPLGTALTDDAEVKMYLDKMKEHKLL